MPDYDGWVQVGENIRCERRWSFGESYYCERLLYHVIERDKICGWFTMYFKKKVLFIQSHGQTQKTVEVAKVPEPFKVAWARRDQYLTPNWEVLTETAKFFSLLENGGRDPDEENPFAP